jgi:MFS family permease
MSDRTDIREDEPTLTPTRSLWRNGNFLLLWSGQTVSALGTRVSALAFPLLILALTHSAAIAGLLIATEMLPYLLFSLPVGALIDRWDRKLVMIVSDSIRWLAMGSISLAFVLGHLNPVLLYIVAFVEGTGNVFFSLAQISSLPRVVHPAHLSRAYALSEVSEFLARLLGPAISAFIIQLARTTVVGAVLAYLVDSVSYLISVISLCFIRIPFQHERSVVATQRSLRADIVEGLRFLWTHTRLRIMVLLTATVNFLQSSISLAVIVLAQQRLHLNVFTLGLIFTAGGVGGLLAGFTAPWIRARLRFGQIIIGSIVIWTVAAALLAIGQAVWMLMLGMALTDMLWPIYSVTLVSYRLEETPDALQGRVNSAFRVVSYGCEPLGAAIGGLLLVPFGPSLVLLGITVGLAMSAIGAMCSELRRA